jgi:hypothetical protein
MKKLRFLFPAVLLFASFLLASCGKQPESTPVPTSTQTATVTPTPVPTLTSTPDPCSQAALPASVGAVNSIMREFDDASLLAQNTPVSQMLPTIADLQRIRREAEDQVIPPCLFNLKTYQINHMNAVIDTLLAFVKGADADAINQGIAQARQFHDQYTLEMARLLGVTLVPPTAAGTPDGTPAPGGTATP